MAHEVPINTINIRDKLIGEIEPNSSEYNNLKRVLANLNLCINSVEQSIELYKAS
jgi:hypothetical protein